MEEQLPLYLKQDLCDAMFSLYRQGVKKTFFCGQKVEKPHDFDKNENWYKNRLFIYRLVYKDKILTLLN